MVLVTFFVTLLPEAVRYGALWESSFHPAAVGHSLHQIVLVGCVDLSLRCSPPRGRPSAVHSGSLPSIRPPSHTVHTRLYLSVVLTFLYTIHSLQRPPECRALCKLLLANLAVFALQEVFSPSMWFAILLSILPPSDKVHN
jgi:hypothetical protein